MQDPPAVPAAPLPQDSIQSTDLQATSLRTMPDLLAMLASLEQTREPLAAALDVVDKEIARVMTLAHQAMSAIGARHFATADSVFELKRTLVYKPIDWPAIHKFIQETGEFDLLHRRLSTTALQQRTELPPGVMQDSFDVPKFSPVKVKR